MLADDVSAVVVDADGRPLVLGAFPQVRLWGDVMDRLEWHGKPRALEDTRGATRKWCVRPERFRDAPLAVRAVVVLSTHDRDTVTLEPVPKSAAFATLVRHTYRLRLVRELGLARAHFRMVAATVRQAPVVQVRRPRDAFQLDELADRIVEYLGNGRC